MKWRFAEGTTVHLGGDVEGDSPFAAMLRRKVASVRRGHGPTVYMEAQPCDGEPMDIGNVAHVDQWLRRLEQCMAKPLVEAPEVEPAPPAPAREPDPNRVY